MTAVVIVNTVFAGAIVVADSRLTRFTRKNEPYPYSDVCQKVVTANSWSVVGYAGLLCPARYLLGGIVQRLRSYDDAKVDEWSQDASLDWLRDDDHLRAFITWGLKEHGELGGVHLSQCISLPTEISVVWVDHRIPPDLREDQVFIPGTHVVTITTPNLAVRRTEIGVDVLGSGGVIAGDFDREFVVKVMNFADGDAFQRGKAQGMFVAEAVRNRIRARSVETVGGLYQIVHLCRDGVQVVPYFYWADVRKGYGTYVAMRMEHGQWVQEHRPTGKVVHLRSPFDIEPTSATDARGVEAMFEPSLSLSRKSKGVMPTPKPLTLVYATYDPDHLPDPIRLSWGDEPIAPLTWSRAGTSDAEPSNEGVDDVAGQYDEKAPE